MKKVNYLGLAMLAVVLLFSSCKEDENIIIDPQVEKVTTTIFGSIVDEDGNLVANALIEMDGKSTSTDDYGNFLFSNVSIPADNAFLLAKKSGYFNGSRTFQPVKNSVNKIKIMLMEKGTAVMVNGATGGDASLGDGTKINLPANGIKKEDGSIYTGMVSVYVKRLNPAADDFEKMMPGDLIAEDLSGEEVALETFGMIVAELEGSSGEKLNIAEGSSAEITLPLDPSVAAGAPATIPLWYFDEGKGLWIEEGSATLVGDKYVGNVSHFSFWNCDAPFPLIKVTGSLLDGNTPLASVLVKVSIINGSTNRPVGTGYTDSTGVFCGKMPANEELLLEVLNQCGEVVTSITIGPFVADINLGNIPADVSTDITEITGSAIDCDNNLIDNVYIEIKDGSHHEYYFGSGASFSIPLIYCDGSSNIEIRIIDIENEKESGWLTYPISVPITNVGNVLACDAIGEYLRFNVNGEEYLVFENINAYLEGGFYHGVSGRNTTTPENVSLNYNIVLQDSSTSIGVGIYYIDGNNSNQNSFTAREGSNSWYGDSIQIVYTTFGDVGELIEGTFSGTLIDSIGTTNISGAVHVLRNF